MDRSNYGLMTEKAGAVQSFLGKVYAWMTAALVLTGLTAYFTASTPTFYAMLFGNNAVLIGLIIAQLAVVIVLSATINRLSAPIATLLFIVYSLLTGLTISSIFLVYTRTSITTVFFITAGMFAAASVVGYFIKKDLTGFGNFLMIGLIGIIIASVVNFFLKSPAIYWIVSYLGVAIFAGLTAYDTQKLKNMSYYAEQSADDIALKMSILGALTLYLDFINMFLYLLRIFGSRER